MRGTWVYRNGRLVEKGGPEDIRSAPARSDLPFPMVVSDQMADCEHVDGKFYSSKSEFRKVTKARGLIEVGNDPSRRAPRKRTGPNSQAISDSVERAFSQFKQGRRVQV